MVKLSHSSVIKISFLALFIVLFSCSSVNFEETQKKINANNFNFIAKSFDSRKSYSVPAGTGRIVSSSVSVTSTERIGVFITPDKLEVNLPLSDKESDGNRSSLEVVSEDFTAARKVLDNGNILVNYFLNDTTEITIVKMEIQKNGQTDCSVEGSDLKPLFYLGTIE